jgi:hypothetical protein
VENYSTVKSAQRLSATLSIRPSGRVQIIDMLLGIILACEDNTNDLNELATLCEQFERLYIRRITSVFRDDKGTRMDR